MATTTIATPSTPNMSSVKSIGNKAQALLAPKSSTNKNFSDDDENSINFDRAQPNATSSPHENSTNNNSNNNNKNQQQPNVRNIFPSITLPNLGSLNNLKTNQLVNAISSAANATSDAFTSLLHTSINSTESNTANTVNLDKEREETAAVLNGDEDLSDEFQSSTEQRDQGLVMASKSEGKRKSQSKEKSKRPWYSVSGIFFAFFV